ncbi:MAG: metalloregulator ArsR/SmtB family transcription factor [Anaerolineaceae bacterium]|nr:metalloregulator ArsR/SmtB family transcription factor [Anaerolineaceae bacterium]
MATTLKGLADPTRLRLLSVLLCGEACVNDLAEKLGMTQSAISHQLRVLRDLKFVSHRRDGQQIIYGIDDEHIADLFQRALEHAEH